jgi:hypothetical protein
MFVCCECCVLSGRGLCDELSPVQRSPTDCDASLCVIYKPQELGSRDPRWIAATQKKKVSYIVRNLSRCTVTWTSNSINTSITFTDIFKCKSLEVVAEVLLQLLIRCSFI